MDFESIPQIDLTGVAVLIFGLCAGFVLLRGVFRMLLGTMTLGLSAWSAFYVWQNTPRWGMEYLGKTHEQLAIWLPLLAFVVSMVVVRKVVKVIAGVFGRGEEGFRSTSPGFLARMVFALIPTAILWLIGATFLHHAGALEEIHNAAEGPAAGVIPGYFQRMRTSAEAVIPASWLAKLDPLTKPGRLALAKLIATQPDASLPPVIDPATGKPIPRAILVEDPTLLDLVRRKDFSTLLHHPNLTGVLDDPAVQNKLDTAAWKSPD